MKNIKAIAILIMCTFGFTLLAQNSSEQLVVELSDPSNSGTLEVGVIFGSIHVESHNGTNIIIDAEHVGKMDEDEEETRSDGMKKINMNNGFEVSATENNNNIQVNSSVFNQTINFTIKVPKNFSLKLNTINNGDITVDNVNGNIEVNNVNGKVILNNISGSAVANTINGDLTVTFNKIDDDTPMAFSTLNGKIEVTLPASTEADLKLKSDFGDVFTDFDIEVKPTEGIEKSNKNGNYRIIKDSWTNGSINGGGAEIMMKNMQGDIYIRKAK